MKLRDTHNKRILFSALNWGFGHVSRSIGLIRKLEVQQNTVIVACDEAQKAVFRSYFPNITYVHHEGYPFEFSGKGNFASDLFAGRKKLLERFVKEQAQARSMADTYKVDLVIADQRYGFFSDTIPSIFVTHQLHLPLRWYQRPAQWINARLIRNFSAVWCMDYEDRRLSGKLSRPLRGLAIDYTGPFSRFEPSAENIIYDKLFVISGPEPYARQFFELLTTREPGPSEQIACIVPRLYEIPEDQSSHLKLIHASDWKENDRIFHQSRTIISRAGYSTLMDLEILRKPAVLIPTPGQAEQIYLSNLHRLRQDIRFSPDNV